MTSPPYTDTLRASALLLCLTALLVLATGCPEDNNGPSGKPDTTPDVIEDQTTTDASKDTPEDTQTDATASACPTTVEIQGDFTLPYSDDVSIDYEAAISPEVEGIYNTLTVMFERNGSPFEQTGTFTLGAGQDANYADCARCFVLKSNTPERAYFATAGEVTVNKDPYTRELDIEVKGLQLSLVSVDELRVSTPVPDTECVSVKDFSFARTFPDEGWTCDAKLYRDGNTCDCNCGIFDPDCINYANECPSDNPLCERELDPLPVVGCQADERCVPISPQQLSSPATSSCEGTCDWTARTPCADADAICLFDTGFDDGDICLSPPARYAAVDIGEPCPAQGSYVRKCAVVDGFATGVCDAFEVCRSLCNSDEECTEDGHTCRPFRLDGPTLGFCGPEPTDG